MLKISSQRTPDSASLTVEGRLTGPWVLELERAWASVNATASVPVEVNLTAVSFIGDDGKALLNRMWQQGAVLIANGCCTGHIVKEITGSCPDDDARIKNN
jgi:hypothetical protein